MVKEINILKMSILCNLISTSGCLTLIDYIKVLVILNLLVTWTNLWLKG